MVATERQALRRKQSRGLQTLSIQVQRMDGFTGCLSFLLQLLNSVPWTNTETKGVALLQSNVTYKNRPWGEKKIGLGQDLACWL